MSKEKYQQAVNNIVTYYGLLNVTKGHYQELADTLQELVDKATPLPRIEPKDSFYLWACPNCKTDFIDNKKSKYCTECGQRFEGSEND